MTKNWKCRIGIHKWRDSVTFSRAVPLVVRHELGTDMQICVRCFKIKEVPFKC